MVIRTIKRKGIIKLMISNAIVYMVEFDIISNAFFVVLVSKIITFISFSHALSHAYSYNKSPKNNNYNKSLKIIY